jgi:hypothetical protein
MSFIDEQGVPLHRFPHPNNRPDLFAAWVAAAGGKLQESDPMTKEYVTSILSFH